MLCSPAVENCARLSTDFSATEAGLSAQYGIWQINRYLSLLVAVLKEQDKLYHRLHCTSAYCDYLLCIVSSIKLSHIYFQVH